jgi:uroporphyrinogen decarboxylase
MSVGFGTMKIPFNPSVYEHAARFTGRTPWEVSRDPDLMFEGHRAAYLEYRHTPIVVGIDIYNLEAEAYGATVAIPGPDGIPAIFDPLVSSLEEARRLPPFDPARDGRIAMVIEVGRRLAAALPQADVRIPLAGPFSIAFNLRGINQLCEDVATEPDAVAGWLMTLAENQAAFARAVVAAGLDVAFFESAAAPPLLSPRQFHQVELPALRHIMTLTASIAGHPVPCIMGGNTCLILDGILSTGTGYVVCNVETNQQRFVDRLCETHPHVNVRINMDPRIVACDDRAAIFAEVDRILAIAAGRPNCLMGTGCLPLETPPENIRLIREYLAAP